MYLLLRNWLRNLKHNGMHFGTRKMIPQVKALALQTWPLEIDPMSPHRSLKCVLWPMFTHTKMVKLKVRVYFSRSIHGWIQLSYEYDTYICMSINMHSVCVCVYIFLASWVRVWFGLSGPLQWRIKEIKTRHRIKQREGERFHLALKIKMSVFF